MYGEELLDKFSYWQRIKDCRRNYVKEGKKKNKLKVEE